MTDRFKVMGWAAGILGAAIAMKSAGLDGSAAFAVLAGLAAFPVIHRRRRSC